MWILLHVVFITPTGIFGKEEGLLHDSNGSRKKPKVCTLLLCDCLHGEQMILALRYCKRDCESTQLIAERRFTILEGQNEGEGLETWDGVAVLIYCSIGIVSTVLLLIAITIRNIWLRFGPKVNMLDLCKLDTQMWNFYIYQSLQKNDISNSNIILMFTTVRPFYFCLFLNSMTSFHNVFIFKEHSNALANKFLKGVIYYMMCTNLCHLLHLYLLEGTQLKLHSQIVEFGLKDSVFPGKHD